MSDELKTIKFQLMLAPSEAEAIDDWGFKNRIRTRAEAIRRLCQIGLEADENTANAHDLIIGAAEWIEQSELWYDEENPAGEGTDDKPARLVKQAHFISNMFLIAARLILAEMINKGDRLKRAEDFEDMRAALAALEDTPDVASAKKSLELFLDSWAEKFPGKGLAPPFISERKKPKE